MQPTIDNFFSKKDSDSEKLARLAEVRFSESIAEHLAKLIKVVKSYKTQNLLAY